LKSKDEELRKAKEEADEFKKKLGDVTGPDEKDSKAKEEADEFKKKSGDVTGPDEKDSKKKKKRGIGKFFKEKKRDL